MPNLTPKTKLIFPEESSTIILSILEKYDLKENDEEFYEKWKKGEKTRGEIITEALITAVKANLSEIELAVLLHEELKIPLKKAEKLAEEFNLKILRQMVKEEPPSKSILKETPAKKEVKEISKTPRDIYREPVE